MPLFRESHNERNTKLMSFKAGPPLPAGTRVGRLVVIRALPHYRYLCVCDCGKTCSVLKSQLKLNRTRSCGCLHREELSQRSIRHGWAGTPEYESWHGMIQRCTNPKNSNYKDYGARGIAVCARWLDFSAFLSDVGPRPSPLHTLERINNNGKYEPGNCRWATRKEQARNTRTSRRLTAMGKTLTVAEWAERAGLKYTTLYRRLRAGWIAEEAIFAPASQGRK
jgi:hypothetical protein